MAWKSWLVSQREQRSPSRPGESPGHMGNSPMCTIFLHTHAHIPTPAGSVQTFTLKGLPLSLSHGRQGCWRPPSHTHGQGGYIYLVPSPRLCTSVSTVSLRTLKGTGLQWKWCFICLPINKLWEKKEPERAIHRERMREGVRERRGPTTAIKRDTRLPGSTWSWEIGSTRISLFMSYLKSDRLKALFKNLGGPCLHLPDYPNIPKYKHSSQLTIKQHPHFARALCKPCSSWNTLLGGYVSPTSNSGHSD